MMLAHMADIGLAAISTALRLLVLIFLRFAPAIIVFKLITTLYALYVIGWLCFISFNGHEQTWESKYVKKEKDADSPHERPHASVLRTLVYGLPDKNPRIRFIHLAINTLLFFASLDLVFHPYFDPVYDVKFTRIGAVYPNGVKVVVRYPEEASANVTQRGLRVVWREVKPNATQESGWKSGPVLTLKESDDWTVTTKLSGLWPDAAYEYKLAYANKTHLPYPASPLGFKTFPDPRLIGTHFKFAASSCIIPGFPYLPFQSRRIKGFDLFDKVFPPTPSTVHRPKTTENATEKAFAGRGPLPLSFFLFLGDFIYADRPSTIRDDLQEYRRLYRRNYASKSFRKVYERLPMLHAYDDHEFINNFVGRSNDSVPRFINGSAAYKIFHGNANYDSPHSGASYYDFRYGDVAFFVLDTRRYRSDVTVGSGSIHTMLGDKQLAALHQWLAKSNSTATFKFLVSSVPFTTLWRSPDGPDTWSSFPSERAALLSVMHTVPNLIIISGDRHEAAIIETLPPVPEQRKILEVSTSPLNQMANPSMGLMLRRYSKEAVNRTMPLEECDDGQLDTCKVEVPRERLIKSRSIGSHKWSTFEVDTRDRGRPVIRLGLWSGGKERYSLEIPGVPVKVSHSVALGAFVPGGFKEMLDRIGMRPSKWF